MKQLFCIIFAVSSMLCGCKTNGNTNYNSASNSSIVVEQTVPENHFYDFPEYGFSITAPCVLEDAPASAKGKNLVCIGGFINKGNEQNFTFYQLMVSDMHDKTEAEVFEFLKNRPGGMRNFKSVTVGGHYAIECDAVTQGVNQKGLFVVNKHYLITLTVISPVELEKKYNDFKNTLTFVGDNSSIKDKSSSEEHADGMKTYSNSLYSVSYPSDWLCSEHPNDFVDVAFGEEVGIAFSVFHIDIDAPLQQIVENGNEEMKTQLNAKVLSHTKIKMCGVDAYKTIFTFVLANGLDDKQISYTLKKGETYYNIRFNGTVSAIDKKAQLIEKIIATFTLKK